MPLISLHSWYTHHHRTPTRHLPIMPFIGFPLPMAFPFPFCKPTAAGAGGTAAYGESMVKLGGLFFKGGIHSYTSTVYCLTPTKADMNSI